MDRVHWAIVRTKLGNVLPALSIELIKVRYMFPVII